MFKVIVLRKEFLNAIDRAGRIVEWRARHAALQCLRMESKDNTIFIASTDLGMSMLVTFNQCQIESSGVVLVNYKLLSTAVKASKSETITLEEMRPVVPIPPLDEDIIHNWDASQENQPYSDSQKKDIQAAFVNHHQKGVSAKDEAARLQAEWTAQATAPDSHLVLRDGCSTRQFSLEKPAEYPPIGESIPLQTTIKGADMKRLIKQTLFAVAKRNDRYACNGPQLILNGVAKMTATDARRLATTTAPTSMSIDPGIAAIIPAKAMTAVDKILGNPTNAAKVDIGIAMMVQHEPKPAYYIKQEADGTKNFRLWTVYKPAETPGKPDEVVCGHETEELAKQEIAYLMLDNATQVQFTGPDWRLITNTVDGQFPPAHAVMPRDCDKVMVASRMALLDAIKQGAAAMTEDAKGVRMDFGERGLVVSSRNPENGESRADLPCMYRGDKITIGFNPDFFADALEAMDSDEVTVEMATPNRPALVTGGDLQYILMPVNLA